MELMKGYKETTVGVIPADWQVVPITSLIEKNSRITYGVVQPGKDDRRGVVFIRGGDVYDGKIDEENLRKIPHSVDSQYSRTKLCGGELLISLVGFPGECAIVPEALKGANIARQVALARLDKILDFESDFICHFLRSTVGKRMLLREAFGSAQQVINLKDINKLELPLPSSLEQRDIARALSDVDALITGLEKLIAKKRDLKQAAMQQLLTGQTRLPGFSGEWELTKLGDVLNFQVGFPFGSGFFNEKEQGLRLIKNRDLKADDQVFFYSGNYEQNYLVKNDDVLVGMDGDFLPCRWTKGEALLNQRVGRLLPTSKLNIRFAYYFMLEPLKKIEAVTASTTVKHLSHSDIENIVKPLPSLDEQIAIGVVLFDIDAELEILESRVKKTCELKQGMMQELLTGRTRLV